ncbi:MAG TPA: preprotein translocase subunit SecE [Thermoanaerobaculia bacterium]|nr:preprotein translocase subunit SecE [Thermoanaerobaculia bacterium]
MQFAPRAWWQSIREFWSETKAEMKKVTWPARREVVSTTGVVLAATIFFGIYLWICDLIFYRLIDFLFTQFGAV